MRAVIELPGGRCLGDGRRVGEAELRGLCGHDEDWLSGCADETPAAVVVTDLLARVTVRLGERRPPTRDDLLDLLVADRDYLLLRLRELSFGGAVAVVQQCPACDQAMDVDFEVAGVPVERRPQRTGRVELEVAGPDGRAARVGVHLPTGRDQEALATTGHNGPLALLQRCVETVDGRPAEAADWALLASLAVQIDEAMERASPSVELAMDLVCPECGHRFAADYPVASLVLDDLRLSARQLMAEVHGLAYYYHWPERDILGLSRRRRRTYLDLVSRQLTREQGPG
jgi:hypothetical protein